MASSGGRKAACDIYQKRVFGRSLVTFALYMILVGRESQRFRGVNGVVPFTCPLILSTGAGTGTNGRATIQAQTTYRKMRSSDPA